MKTARIGAENVSRSSVPLSGMVSRKSVCGLGMNDGNCADADA